MPLDDYTPRIDDRRFDDLVAEARTRIARYTPEWTDFNDNDPGIALVQLFAWLTEMLIYRLGRVPQQNYIKFLQLLGIELRPAEPALAEITFPVLDAPATPPYVIVPARTQVSAPASDGGPPVIFETERALFALTPRLASVQSFDGFDFADVTAESEALEPGFEPFGPRAELDSALYLGFKYDKEFPAQVEMNLAFWSQAVGAGTNVSSCALPDTQVFASAQLRWEFWNGSEWRALSLLKDETRSLTRTGHLYLRTPGKGEMAQAVFGEVAEARYWVRGRVAGGSYESPPRLQGVRTNTVSATQAESVADEVLGGSDGRPHQFFALANTPVLAGTLRLEVDEGDGFREWTRVEDFFGSKPDDLHYVLNRTSGEVRFGDGVTGRIPVGNVDNPGGNIVARAYRFGGGKRGNLAARTLKTVMTFVPGVDENGVGNVQPAAGGRDEETLEEAKLRAPQTLKSKSRAVTEEDFERLAAEAANIRRAKALPLHHPDFPGTRVPGAVTVVVVPDTDDPSPTPSEGTIRTVCAYLNQRRLLTTEVYVVAPTYREVRIHAEVVAAGDADLGEVKQAVERALLDYFHPLKGGESGLGWPFGGNIFFSRVYQRVFTVPGVERIESLLIELDGEESPECKDVAVDEGILLYSTAHEVQVGYSFEE